MDSKHGALVVIGSGPGVGQHVATLFAERGFTKVILMSRNAERLLQDASAVRSARPSVNVEEIVLDAADRDSVKGALRQADESLKGNVLECVLFNAFRPGPSKFFEFPAEIVEADLRICVVALYEVAKWAMPKLFEARKLSVTRTPSILVTSGMLAKEPFPAMFSLAAGKAAQHSLVHSLHKEFQPKGVQCALVTIAGMVGEESAITNPRTIAQEVWKLFEEAQGEGQRLEVVLADPAYADHVKSRER